MVHLAPPGYVAAPVPFAHGPNRLPFGPIPWTLAHAAGVAPHGLSAGQPLAGPWYPRVYPAPLPEEHAPLPGPAWSLGALLSLAGEAEANGRAALNGSGAPEGGFLGFDGPVRAPQEWAFVKVPDAPVEFLYHKRGEGFKAAAAALGAK